MSTSSDTSNPRVSIAKVMKFTTNSFTKIKVGKGENATIFMGHRSVLDKHTSYFSRALASPLWKESQDRAVELSEDEPEIFELYLHAIYRGELPTEEDDPEVGYIETGDNDKVKVKAGTKVLAEDVVSAICTREFNKLCKLYVLAEKLIDSKMKNLVIRTIWAATQHERLGQWWPRPHCQAISIAFEGTPENSNLRRLLSAIYMHYVSGSWIGSEPSESWPKDFLYMIARDCLDGSGKAPIKIEDFLDNQE